MRTEEWQSTAPINRDLVTESASRLAAARDKQVTLLKASDDRDNLAPNGT